VGSPFVVLAGLSALAGLPAFPDLVRVGGRAFGIVVARAAEAAHDFIRERLGFSLGHAARAQGVEYPGSPADPSAFSGFCHGVYLLPYFRTPDESD
jgi:hypothetical protein